MSRVSEGRTQSDPVEGSLAPDWTGVDSWTHTAHSSHIRHTHTSGTYVVHITRHTHVRHTHVRHTHTYVTHVDLIMGETETWRDL